ncbi:hypothetical protein SB775_08635 [Peribacillus sp. SIMBA_075]
METIRKAPNMVLFDNQRLESEKEELKEEIQQLKGRIRDLEKAWL